MLDATTGQNAVNQAKLFSETAPITGIVLTKLDGTAKGGIVISIKNELGIPVKLIGVGEKIDDLQPFDSNMFVDALFASPEQLEELAEEEEAAEAYDEDEYEEETGDDNTVEVDGVKGYYNEYGAFIPYAEDEEDEEESYDEEYEEEETEEEYDEESEDESEYEYEEESDDESDEETEEADDSELTEDEESEEEDDSDEEDEAKETEEEPEAAEPEKKKKRGFFSRLFGGKDDD